MKNIFIRLGVFLINLTVLVFAAIVAASRESLLEGIVVMVFCFVFTSTLCNWFGYESLL